MDAVQHRVRRAAEVVASPETRFARVSADLTLLKWMTGFVVAGVGALVVKTFFG